MESDYWVMKTFNEMEMMTRLLCAGEQNVHYLLSKLIKNL